MKTSKAVLLAVGIGILLAQVGCVSMDKKKSDIEDISARLHPAPRIISRVEWGANPPKIDMMKPHQPFCITLHHGGVYKDPAKDPVKGMQALQSWCMRERPWGDIPYHYLIDMQGRIYEGRPDVMSGDTNTEYDPTGHLLVEVMGNYEEQVPTEDQLRAIVEIMAYLCDKYDVSPDTIKSHRDHSAQTVCPGKNLYTYIQNGYFVKEVKALLESQKQK